MGSHVKKGHQSCLDNYAEYFIMITCLKMKVSSFVIKPSKTDQEPSFIPRKRDMQLILMSNLEFLKSSKSVSILKDEKYPFDNHNQTVAVKHA